MMINHLDGTQTPAYGEALPLIGAESDVNRIFFWSTPEHDAVKDYAIRVIWNPETKREDWSVARIGDVAADVPEHVQQLAVAAVDRFVANLQRERDRDVFRTQAPARLRKELEGTAWKIDDDGMGAILPNPEHLVYLHVADDGLSWQGSSYNKRDPRRDGFSTDAGGITVIRKQLENWVR
jgi:hypothetical protein